MGRSALGLGFASALAAGALACTSSQTSTAVTAPASAKCQVQLGSPATAFTADGGSSTLAVSTTRDCTWSVTTSVNWVAVANAEGQGEASVPYTVAANPVPVPRAASITVSDSTVQVSQAAAPCRFAMNKAADTIGSGGGQLAVVLTVLSGCTWTAVNDASWVTIAAGAGGSGGATIMLTVAANTGAVRVGHIQVADQVYTITQTAGTAPAPSPSPDPTPPPTPPPPTPPPPAPTPVHLIGTMSGLSGKCPEVSFTVSATKVNTTSTTAFTDRKCTDLRNGRSTDVTGLAQPDKSVLATIVVQ